MADPALIAQAFQQLRHAVAVARSDDLRVVAENALFFQYFPPTPGADEDRLPARLPKLEPEKLRERLARGRPFALEAEVKAGPRTVNLMLELRGQEIDGAGYVIVEARDVSKQREAEYMLDSYARMAEKHAREVEREKERVEKLLLNIMPRTIYRELRDFGAATPQKFESASVLMLDFVGFTQMAVSRDPSAIVAELNDIFSSFDRIVELFGCERIKTIGDAYMAVSGVPDPNVDHARSIAKAALRFRRYLEKRNAAHPTQWRCRIGIHTGALIGSLVGVQKYVYDVFGPAVNLASRLEAVAEPMQIALTEDTRVLLDDEFVTEPLGEVEIRGFGPQQLHALVGERPR
jgi:adenylate cyclase